MAIRPTRFHLNGTIDVVHDEANHGGVVSEDDVHFLAREDGTEDLRFLILSCPVSGCDSESVHPVGGGCDPVNVQRMFARKFKKHPKRPDVPGLEKAPERPWEDAKGVVKRMAEAMDGKGRFRLEHVAEGEV